MRKVFYMALSAAVALLPGCKNDDEQDYLDYLASQQRPEPDTPETDAGVFLNELDGNSKSIEFYNTGDTDADISGYTLIKDEGKRYM